MAATATPYCLLRHMLRYADAAGYMSCHTFDISLMPLIIDAILLPAPLLPTPTRYFEPLDDDKMPPDRYAMPHALIDAHARYAALILRYVDDRCRYFPMFIWLTR